MSGRVFDAEGDAAIVDATNEALITMGEIHSNIHRGIMFQADFVNLTVASAGTIEMIVRVIADTSAHMRFIGTLDGVSRAQLFEGPTTTADGAAVSRSNRNRFSSTTADTLVFSGPTVTVDGTALADGIIPGGTGGNAIGGSMESFEEWLLSPGDYLLRLTNISGVVKAGSVALDWYEPAT